MDVKGTKARLDWVDAGRGLAILLVVNFHAANWLGANGAGFDTVAWQTVNQTVATIRLPLFFVMAGLFAQKWMFSTWFSLWNSKISLLTWTFGLWSIIATFSFMLGMYMQGQEGNYLSQLSNLLWAPILPRFELWFIWALSIFFIVARLIHKAPIWLQLSLAACFSFVALSGWIETNVGWLGMAKYFFFFLFGLLLRERILHASHVFRPAHLTVACVVWLGASLCGVFLNWFAVVPGFYFLTCIFGLFAGLGISKVLSYFSTLREIGSKTLPIYLTHTTIILIVAWALWHLPPEVKSLAASWVVVPLATVFATWLALRIAQFCTGRSLIANLYEAPRSFKQIGSPRRT